MVAQLGVVVAQPMHFALFSPLPFCPKLHSGFVGVAVVAGTVVGAIAGTLARRRKRRKKGMSFGVGIVVELEHLLVSVGVDQIACLAVVAIASWGGCWAPSCDWNCLKIIYIIFCRSIYVFL